MPCMTAAALLLRYADMKAAMALSTNNDARGLYHVLLLCDNGGPVVLYERT